MIRCAPKVAPCTTTEDAQISCHDVPSLQIPRLDEHSFADALPAAITRGHFGSNRVPYSQLEFPLHYPSWPQVKIALLSGFAFRYLRCVPDFWSHGNGSFADLYRTRLRHPHYQSAKAKLLLPISDPQLPTWRQSRGRAKLCRARDDA